VKKLDILGPRGQSFSIQASNSEGFLPPKDAILFRASQLVGVQQALFEGSIWVALWRMFHNIQDEADGLLDESRDQVVIPDLIPVDAMKAKTALS
jgi:hypothetical protein